MGEVQGVVTPTKGEDERIPKHGGAGGKDAQSPRFASEEEFESFWMRLEEEAEAEREASRRRRVERASIGVRDSFREGPESASQASGDGITNETSVEATAQDGRTLAAFVEDVSDVDESGAYDRLMQTIHNRPLASELMRRTLVLCLERQPYAEAEGSIQSFPEYGSASMTPYQIISSLISAGGLRKLEIGYDGEEVMPEMKAGLDPDDADDLVASYALETTDLGRVAAQDISPTRRLASLFSDFADRNGVFSEILAFCEGEPRTYADIEGLLKGRDFSGIASLNPQPGVQIQPSVFVDNLEKAGGLVWDGGWRLTSEGEELLETLAQ